MSLKHTPGPWKVLQEEYEIEKFIQAKYSRLIAEIYECDKPESVHANARLIAAAPKMLESLICEYKEMCNVCTLRHGDVCEQDGCPNNTLIKTVIESATGMTIEEVLSD